MTDLIERLYPPCVRCHEPNEPRISGDELPWCAMCSDDLQAMSFDGEQVLGMVLDMMPPTPPDAYAPVRAASVLKIARQVLIDRGVLNKSREDENEELRKKLGL